MKTVFFSAVAASVLSFSTVAYAKEAAGWPFPSDIPAVDDTVLSKPAGTAEALLAQYYQVQSASNATISPDGKTIAYQTSVSGEPQLWVAQVAGGTPKQLTSGSGVRSFYWTPDGSGLVYRADTEGDELDSFAYISKDGQTKQSLKGAGAAFSSFGSFSSDGSKFVFSSTARNGDDFDLYIQSMKGGAAKRVYEGKFGWYPDGWQPGGDYVIVTETRGEDGADLFLFNTKSGKMIPIYQPKVSANFEAFNWTKDGAGFYMAANLDREFQALTYYDLKSGEMAVLETPAGDVEQVRLGAGDRYIAWVINGGGYYSLKVRDLEKNLPVVLPKLPRGVYSIKMAKDAPVLQIRITSPKIPGDVWAYNIETETLSRVTTSNAAGLDLAQMVLPETVSFKARDGVDLYGLFYAPPEGAASTDGKPPVVLRVHGGPTGQAKPTFNTTIQYLLSRGYAVLDLNFRGSTGYGKKFARLDNGRLRTNAVRDIADTMAWLKESGRVDTGRAAVYGGSYGGYLVNAVLGDYPELFTAGVSFVGVSDWVRALEEASPSLKASDRIEYGDITDPKERKFYAAISPLRKAGDIKAPVFVVHGANDPRDPVTESDRFVKTIRDAGGNVEYIRLKDEGHSIRKVRNKVHVYTRMAAFLDEHLLGIAPKKPEKQAGAASPVKASAAAAGTAGSAMEQQLTGVQEKAKADAEAQAIAAQQAKLEQSLVEARAALEAAEADLVSATQAKSAAEAAVAEARADVEALEEQMVAGAAGEDDKQSLLQKASDAIGTIVDKVAGD